MYIFLHTYIYFQIYTGIRTKSIGYNGCFANFIERKQFIIEDSWSDCANIGLSLLNFDG